MEKFLITGDWHYPFIDENAFKLFVKFLRYFKPDKLILNGDIYDCWGLASKFRKLAPSSKEFAQEIRNLRKLLRTVREILPNCNIYWVEGNHEFRLKIYLMEKAPMLYDVPIGADEKIRIENIFWCSSQNIWYYPLRDDLTKFSHNYKEFDDLIIGHFDKVLSEAGYTARWVRDNYIRDAIQNHTHRIGVVPKTFGKKVLIGYEAGCLCASPSYINDPNWQLGWMIAYRDKKTKKLYPYPIILREYKFIFEGKTFRI